ncbi:MAG: hypothetical protein A7316_09960 [Candidatus Altiarchaeales archaeon WOR_SM1_86-2]|nr:MAG: hypothetical protein A7316_09960 [Candidatus Altiarchaeales archaeon WOR_SM1_86-2]ODS37825.1 MAG: hypothetical protein A7315_13145 [Candidatus Altiarchaeales archaeon WOR_SM1_79]
MKIRLSKYRQKKEYTCVPASIKIILEYLGADIPESEIEKACKTGKEGTLLRNVENGVKKLGHNVLSFENGTIDFLIECISRKLPVIVVLKVSDLPYGHAGIHGAVVCGFEHGKMIYIDPGIGEEVELELEIFLKSWKSLGSKGFIIW